MIDGYFFHWDAVWRALPMFLGGVVITVQVAALSILFGLLLGVPLALARVSPYRALSSSALVYIEAMRNSPSLVKMYFIFFGLPSLGLFPSPFWSGVLALSLHNSAYMAEIFRGGLQAVPRSQMEAARSLGMGSWLSFQVVLFPQAFRNAMPGFANNWVEIVKDTSLTSALAVEELFYTTTKLISSTQRSFEFLAFAAGVYLVLTTLVSGSLRIAEARTKYRR